MCKVGASWPLLMQEKWNHLYTQEKRLKGGIGKGCNTIFPQDHLYVCSLGQKKSRQCVLYALEESELEDYILQMQELA
jgi:hypothetical protein